VSLLALLRHEAKLSTAARTVNRSRDRAVAIAIDCGRACSSGSRLYCLFSNRQQEERLMRKQALLPNAAALVASRKGSRAWRLGIVKELLADLRTATVAGQRFTIEKIVKLMEEETAAARSALSELQRRGLTKALGDLQTEQQRPSPRVDAFAVRAETMLWTLALV
jgi:hypothetical protein